MNIRRMVFSSLVAFTLLTSPAFADDLPMIPIPPPTLVFPTLPVPDPCLPVCLSFTNTTALTMIQQVIGQVYQLQAEYKNLESLPTSFASIDGYVGRITAAESTVNGLSTSVGAANVIKGQMPTLTTLLSKLDGDGSGASGQQQQSEAENEQLAALNQTESARLSLDAAGVNDQAAGTNALHAAASQLSRGATLPEYY